MATREYPEIQLRMDNLKKPTCLDCILRDYMIFDKDGVKRAIRDVLRKRGHRLGKDVCWQCNIQREIVKPPALMAPQKRNERQPKAHSVIEETSI